MADIVVYGFPPAPDVRTVRMTLFEHGVEHALEPFLPGSPEMRALHPLGKVPALLHGDVRLFETVAICSYVDETFGGLSLHPSCPAERAVMLQWWTFYHEEAYPWIVPSIVVPRLMAARHGEPVDEDAVADAVPKAREHLEILDSALRGRKWFANSRLSLADLAIAPMVELVSMMPEADRLLGGLDHLGPWLERVRRRDSFQRSRVDA